MPVRYILYKSRNDNSFALGHVTHTIFVTSLLILLQNWVKEKKKKPQNFQVDSKVDGQSSSNKICKSVPTGDSFPQGLLLCCFRAELWLQCNYSTYRAVWDTPPAPPLGQASSCSLPLQLYLLRLAAEYKHKPLTRSPGSPCLESWYLSQNDYKVTIRWLPHILR